MTENPKTPPVDRERASRPGVPMERPPQPLMGAHWTRPERQPAAPGVTHRPELKQMTPVFGTAQPLKGLSGLLRRTAYTIPETFVRHWLLLLVADRVDVFEARLGRWGKRAGVAGVLGLAGWAVLRTFREA